MTSPNLRSAPAVLAALVALAACGDTGREPEPLRVNTRTGATVDLSRTTWEVCVETPPAQPEGAPTSLRARIVHGEDGVVTYTSETFGQPGCAGQVPVQSLSFLGFADGARAVGWAGGTPPDGVDVSSPFATRVFLDGPAIGTDCFWVDDVSQPRVLYAGDNASPASDGYPDLLSATGFIEVR